ncbi:chaplin [Streptomyces adustus]|nr:chaplin [Streptomyces adustus]
MKKTAAVVAGLLLALGGAAPAFADADAGGMAVGSPGVLSGNVIEIPVNIPVNLCGDSVDLIGLLNPAGGSVCDND